MAPRKGSGRRAAKNETAAALINALKFMGVLKTPPAGSPVQYDYVFLNQGYAIGFDGVVAAGHPIPGDISGYPHTKLLNEALENTDKTFSLTRRDDGAFEVGSDKYSAIVPVCPAQVIPTFPDNKQGQILDPTTFIAALEVTQKVTTETGTIALYSAVRFGEATLMATNGAVMLEVRHNNPLPPVTVPRQFVTAILKSGKTPEAIGINGADWSTLTIWFSDGSWLRTNLYGPELFGDEVLQIYTNMTNAVAGHEKAEIPAKLWATIKAVLPFAVDNRVMLRPGIIRTHPEAHQGAALELDKIAVTVDVNGKQFLALEELAATYAVVEYEGRPIVSFAGGGVEPLPLLRGVMAGLNPLPTVEMPAAGGWGQNNAPAGHVEGPDSAPQGSAGGWAMAEVAPPADEPPPRREAAPQTEWKGGPAEGLANDPEFLSQYHDQPESDFKIEPEEAYLFTDKDKGIDWEGISWGEAIQEGLKPSGWLNSIDVDKDGGFQSEGNPPFG